MKKVTRWQERDFSAKFLSCLISKKEEIEKTFSNLMEKQKEYRDLHSSDNLKEDGDHAEREISLQKHYSILERKTRELQGIDILIRKALNDQKFGICEDCGKQIPIERLLIVPDAVRCVPCQRESEKLTSGRTSQRSYKSSRKKSDIYWEATNDFDDENSCIIQTDMDYITFVDLEDFDPEEGAPSKN